MTISGREYIKRIDALNNEVWVNGQKITGNISEHPAFKGIMKSKAHLFDLQNNEDHKELLTFKTSSKKEVGFSFQQPTTLKELEKRWNWLLEDIDQYSYVPVNENLYP